MPPTAARNCLSSLNHVPLIGHNPRGGEKVEFEPPDALHCNECTVAERMNARHAKDEFGDKSRKVKGAAKVMGYLILASGSGPPTR